MKYLKPFTNFENNVNEGLFDKLTTMFSKVTGLFKDVPKLNKGIEAVMTEQGDKAANFNPKMLKHNETSLVVMGDGKNSALNFSVAFTKLADLPDGSSLFQISGTSSPEMLKALTGSDKEEDLTKNNVMAIVAPGGFLKGKPATMRLLKNVMPAGKDYVTKSLIAGAVSTADAEKMMAKIK